MADEYIQRAPVLHSVENQTGKQDKCPQVGFSLGVLVHPVGPVADGAAESADEEFFEAHDFQIQIGSALGVGLRRARVMVPRHIIHRHVQHGHEVFQVWVGHIPAAEDEFHILKMAVGSKRVNALHNLVAQRKNFHSPLILPQKVIPRKSNTNKTAIVWYLQFPPVRTIIR